MLIKADLGCGLNKHGPDFVGVDSEASFKPDVVHDLTLGMPFTKDSVSEVCCSHFLEHIPSDKVIVLMNSMPDQCINGALITIRVPLNFADPSHKEILGYDWINWLVKSVPSSLVLMKYIIETMHTTSILAHEFGKPFSYEQATVIFKVMK